jgi:Ca2+-binding RTX toxin-like protein
MAIGLYVGGTGNDRLIGTNKADYFYGDLGNDFIRGGGGVDTLRGSTGDDDLDGGAGSDFLDGGIGQDVLYGGTGDARDILAGHGGNDRMDGGGGADTLDGGGGVDRMTGGAGADVFYYSAISDSTSGARDVITDFGAGDKIDLSSIDAKLHTAGGQDFTFIGTKAFTAEGQIRFAVSDGHTFVQVNTSGAGGAEMVIDLLGNIQLSAANFVFGVNDKSDTARDDAIFTHGDTVDRFNGGGGADYVFGDAGNDYVSGGGDTDMVRGGLGDDTVDGGRGDDVLYGGDGRDIFVFRAGDGRDIIQDFTRGFDKIQFAKDAVEGGVAGLSMEQSGSDVVIHDGSGGELIVAGVRVSDLSARDFLFA